MYPYSLTCIHTLIIPKVNLVAQQSCSDHESRILHIAPVAHQLVHHIAYHYYFVSYYNIIIILSPGLPTSLSTLPSFHICLGTFRNFVCSLFLAIETCALCSFHYSSSF